MRRPLLALGFSWILILPMGCGAFSKYSISGTITHGGEKLTWPEGGMLLVIFMPNDSSSTERYSAFETDTDASTYKVTGIPPGRYRVAVQQFDKKFMDSFGRRYDLGHTDLVVEVTHEGQILDIDVPKSAEEDAPKPKMGGGRKKGTAPKEPNPENPGQESLPKPRVVKE